MHSIAENLSYVAAWIAVGATTLVVIYAVIFANQWIQLLFESGGETIKTKIKFLKTGEQEITTEGPPAPPPRWAYHKQFWILVGVLYGISLIIFLSWIVVLAAIPFLIGYIGLKFLKHFKF